MSLEAGGGTHERTNERTNGRTNKRKSPCVLQDIVPFGAAAQKAYFRSERVNFSPERADFRPERVDFSPEKADFRPERAWGGRTNERTNGRTNKSPPVFYRTSSPWGPLPKRPKLGSKRPDLGSQKPRLGSEGLYVWSGKGEEEKIISEKCLIRYLVPLLSTVSILYFLYII